MLFSAKVEALRSAVAAMDSSKELCVQDAEFLLAAGKPTDAAKRLKDAAQYAWGFWRPDGWDTTEFEDVEDADDEFGIVCGHCRRSVSSVDAAIESGWIPSYWDVATDEESDHALCPECVETLGILADDDGPYLPVGDLVVGMGVVK